MKPEFNSNSSNINEAHNLFRSISEGHATALFVPNSNVTFRKLVADANAAGDCIINVGKGYYRPIPGNQIDEEEFEYYVARELHRSEMIAHKRISMINSFDERKRRKKIIDLREDASEESNGMKGDSINVDEV